MVCDLPDVSDYSSPSPLTIFADYQARSGGVTLIMPVSVTAVKMHCGLAGQTAF